MWEFLSSSLELPAMLKKKREKWMFSNWKKKSYNKKAKPSGKNEESIKGKYKRTSKLDLLKPS